MELDEISSKVTKLEIAGNSDETDYDSETSESAADERTDDSESGEDDEATECGMNSEKSASSMSNSSKGNGSDSEETSNDDSDGSDGEETSASFTDAEDTFKTEAIDETEDPNEKESKRIVITDRGGGDADQPHFDSDVFTIVDDGTGCATMRVRIVKRSRQHDPQAYQKWIQAKNEEIRRNREMEKLRAQQLDEQKRREEEQRKQISKAKVDEWMQRMRQKKCSGGSVPSNIKATSSSTQQFIHNDADARFKAWLQRVKQREQEKRAKELLQKQREMEEREIKKKVSQEICKEWLKAAKDKSRPVPLNQGPNTLKGTVSNIFVNPEPWKSNCE